MGIGIKDNGKAVLGAILVLASMVVGGSAWFKSTATIGTNGTPLQMVKYVTSTMNFGEVGPGKCNARLFAVSNTTDNDLAVIGMTTSTGLHAAQTGVTFNAGLGNGQIGVDACNMGSASSTFSPDVFRFMIFSPAVH